MVKSKKNRKFDLEERSFSFASRCRDFANKIPKNISNIEYARQLVRSSGSVAANYIEANESFSKKDYYHRVKICRKEVKESRLWLRLVEINRRSDLFEELENLVSESEELSKIFGSIIEKGR